MRAVLKGLAKRLSGAINSVEGGPPNSILFTFDDGPHPEITPQILSLLAQHGASAVFFIVGKRIPRAPHLLRTIVEEGHALGNHSFSHPNDRPLAPAAFIADLHRCQQTIAHHAGVEPRLFRPPLGRLSLGSVVAARALRLKTLLWTVDTGDWRLSDLDTARARGIEIGADLSSKKIHNEILLMHDDNPCSVEVLKEILPVVKSLKCDLSSPLERILH